MKLTTKTYTLPEIRRLKRDHFTIEGVVVDEELVSSEGMQFIMIDLGEDFSLFRATEAWLKQQRDVVGPVLLAQPERCPECHQTEEMVGFYLDGGESGYELICNGCGSWFKSPNWHNAEDYRG